MGEAGTKESRRECVTEEGTGRITMLCGIRGIEEGGRVGLVVMVTGFEVVPKCMETYKGDVGSHQDENESFIGM